MRRGPGEGKPTVAWQDSYNAGTHAKAGQANAGTGTTLTLTGQNYIAISDSAEPQMHVAVWHRTNDVQYSRLVCEVTGLRVRRELQRKLARNHGQVDCGGECLRSLNHQVNDADVGPTRIKDCCPIAETVRQVLSTAMRHTCPGGQCQGMQLSERAYYRILKLARMIANLAGEERIGTAHIAEAIHLRPCKQA